MAKDPAFLFYPNDYIGGTMGMTFEEKGAYIELLMLQFNRGHMTSHMIGQSVGQIWDKIQDKFIKDEKGLYYNVRLEQEQENRKSYSNSRRNNLSGKNQYSKKKEKEIGHMTSHMENVNEDILHSTLTNKEIFENLKFELFNSHVWISDCERTLKNNNIKMHLKDFLDHLFLQDNFYKDISEVKKHFINWVKLKIKNPDKEQKIVASGNYGTK